MFKYTPERKNLIAASSVSLQKEADYFLAQM